MTRSSVNGIVLLMRVVAVIIVSCLVTACQYEEGADSMAADVYRLSENGETASLLVALKAGGEVDPRDVCYRTPLMLAAQFGRIETVRRLLAAGANAHLHEKGYYSALMLAAGN